MKNAWNMWIKRKRRGKKDIPALEDKILWEKIGGKWQKIGWAGSVEEREQKAFWKFEESDEHVREKAFF